MRFIENAMLEKYLKYTRIADSVEYEDKASVARSNKAVDSMYTLVREAVQKGETELSKLYPLLDDASAMKWLAHQLVESTELPKNIENKCFSIIETLANKNDPNSYGEELWLKEWAQKRGRA